MSKKKSKKKKKRKPLQVASAPAEQRENFDQIGLNLFRQGNYPEAIKAWRKASSPSLAPKIAEACFRNGLSFYKKGRVVQVLSELHQAIQSDPENALYRFHLGLAYHRKGNMEKALSWYDKALEADPKNARFRYHLGMAYLETECFQKARDQFLSLEDGDLYARGLGVIAVLLKQGQREEALAGLKETEEHPDSQRDALKGLVLMTTNSGRAARNPLRSAATEGMKKGMDVPWIQYYLGLSYAADGHFPSAAKVWEQAMNAGLNSRLIESDLSAVYHRLAAKEVAREAFGKAIAYWEKILKLQPQDEVARDNAVHGCFLMGNRCSEKGDLKKAIRWWTRVVDLDPGNMDVAHNLALAYDRLDNVQEANRYWKKVVDGWRKQRHSDEALSGMLHVAHRHLAENYVKMDHLEKAANEYQQAVRYNPEDIPAWIELGELQLNTGKLSAAVRTLERARALDRKNTDCLNALAMAYCERSDCRKALRCWQEVMRIEPNNRVASEQLVECVQHQTYLARMRGSLNHAISILRETLALCPKQMQLCGLLGELYLQQEKPEEAADIFSQAVAADPEKPDPYVTAGHVFLMAHRESEAQSYFEQALTLAPEDADLLIFIGASYSEAEQSKASRRYFRRAMDLAPNDAGIPMQIGATLTENDFPEQAIPYFHLASHLSPGMAQAHLSLGMAYLENDDPDQAEKALKLAMKYARKDKDSELIELIRALQREIKFVRTSFGSPEWF